MPNFQYFQLYSSAHVVFLIHSMLQFVTLCNTKIDLFTVYIVTISLKALDFPFIF